MVLLKVLLVDDEPFVIEGLKIMVDWNKYGFSICGEASNGEDALEIVKSCNPHLVVTDIRMPVMDGLQLIKAVYETSDIRSKFVVLSGYDDFEYIQMAMRYNVSDYILKPLDVDELDRVMDKVCEQIKEESTQIESRNKQLDFIADTTIQRIINGEVKESIVNRANFILELEKDEDLGLIMFEIDDFDKWMSDFDEIKLRLVREDIRTTIKKSMNNRFDHNIFEDDLGRFFIITSQKMEFYDNIHEYVDILKCAVEDTSNCVVSVALSENMKGIESLENLYKQVDLAISYKFFKGKGNIIRYSDIQNLTLNYDFNDFNIDNFLNDLKNNNYKALSKRINSLFYSFLKNLTAPEIIKAYIENLELEVISSVLGMNGNIDELSRHFVRFNSGMEKSTLETLKNDFTELCRFLTEYMDTLAKNTPKDIITEMKEYIKLNYNKDISLKTIAKQLYVNPVYLGRLFRKNTGIQFNEYLHSVRIEEAKKLLRRTNMKIADIAKSVGYNDVDYFVSKFKHIEKILPSALKNK
jgi:two-component system response regulator YesN